MIAARPTLIQNCRLFDGLSEATREGVDVLIRQGQIECIGGDIRPSADAVVIEATGQTLLPGLIDTHVHLTFDGSGDPVGHLLARSGYASLLVAVHSAWQHLQRGVTTVRDLGSPAGLVLELRQAIQQGLIPGPFIVASDQVITTTGGHCFFMGLEVDDHSEMRRAVCGRWSKRAPT
jgi:imidazolonepropionase-like amidohydrolase